MMKLFTAGPSPFGRKIKMALDVVGLTDNVELVAVDTAAPDSENRRLNPLGKIPTLIVDDNAI
ncbi:MAG: glutathione S-transferase N-terminal domain-containing protein, partial [Candidatus Puniceispirillaceae bacterium]